jgi:hypothetical protein
LNDRVLEKDSGVFYVPNDSLNGNIAES